jgi:hypothetical protein
VKIVKEERRLSKMILYVGGSINGDTPIAGWLRVDNPIKMDDLGF